MTKLIDTTLREGEQTPGVRFTSEQKKRIIAYLCEVGIEEIEVGISSPRAYNCRKLIEFTRSNFSDVSLSLWSRCIFDDITHAAHLAPDILSLSVPISDIHLETKFGRNRGWARSLMLEGIDMAKRHKLRVSVGFEDATRSDPRFLIEMGQLAQGAGAERIRLADTVGLATPLELAALISKLKMHVPGIALAVHTHNDFGMGTANGIAALESGAEFVDATVLGLGERAGCARLEEIVGFLIFNRGQTRYNGRLLKCLASYVANCAGKPIGHQKPIIGKKIFTCETGLHLQGILKNPRTYEPFCPERVGAQRELLFGNKSGRRANQMLTIKCKPTIIR